tara:strand:+ start:266 stop:430 length:165 start_codon:yes stop_codon:yes gene_type:complete
MWIDILIWFAVFCLLMISWCAWELSQWRDIDIDIEAEEIGKEMWHGLHLSRGRE